MPRNKVRQFAFWFVMWMLATLVRNRVWVWAFGYHRMGWTAVFGFALFLASLLTLWMALFDNPKTT